jgi:hypothetical protein
LEEASQGDMSRPNRQKRRRTRPVYYQDFGDFGQIVLDGKKGISPIIEAIIGLIPLLMYDVA